jgi:hypothetical protein
MLFHLRHVLLLQGLAGLTLAASLSASAPTKTTTPVTKADIPIITLWASAIDAHEAVSHV